MNRPILAYAFWHWKQAGVAREQYEAAQIAFQAALRADPPLGYLGGSTFRITGVPWAADGDPAYEDWYGIRDMAGLEQLNDAAVSGSRAQPHLAVARLAGGGIAGLYGLRAGKFGLPVRAACWFAKPAGMDYAALDALLAALVGQGGQLWSRRMTLGPTPEFCLRSPKPLLLPAPLARARGLALEPLVLPG